MSVITALTAQNTREVTGIFPVPPDFIGQQIDAVLSDIGTDAVKIGMLHSPEVIVTVARHLKNGMSETWCWIRSWWPKAETNCFRTMP